VIDADRDYWVSETEAESGLASLVPQPWHLTRDATETLDQVFLDTFDWSLYLAGATLAWREGTPGPDLVWEVAARPGETLVQDAPTCPTFPADLPPGPVRARLLKLAAPRRLLPMIQIHTEVHGYRLHDATGATVARLALARSRFRDPRGGHGQLRPRLRIQPLAGQEDKAMAAVNETGLEPAPVPLLLEALAAAGRRPADYSSKIDFTLDPAVRADTVTREVLRGLFATLEANVDGTRDNLDPEFLHDLRVAVRRTRSALAQLRGVFPAGQIAHFKEGFAWLQRVTGPVRDLDVYLLDFDGYQQALPAALRPHLKPLRSFLLSHYGTEQRRLADALESERFARLRAEWRDFLAAPPPLPGTSHRGSRPIKEVADRQIRRLIKRVRREARRLRPDSPPRDLHELRKRCKKLRYLMEFFQSIYPREPIRAVIALMKTLLDKLGNYQDLEVQATHLRDLAHRMRDAHEAPTETLLAMGALIGHLSARQQEARTACDQVFAEFLSPENRERLRTLFGPQQTPQTCDGSSGASS
jgi:CHAD domain-containing protein